MTANTSQFKRIEPSILYFGNPVALISSRNEDGSTNLAPISSFWALGWNMVLGLLDETKTAENLARTPECIVNIPSPELWPQVEKLAPLTGKNPVPEIKTKQFHFCADKFAAAGLTRTQADQVPLDGVLECPIRIQASVRAMHPLSGQKLNRLGGGIAAEIEVIAVDVAEDLITGSHYINPEKWSPLIYNFRHYFSLADKELGKTFRAER